jgi:hypothetical protein
LGIAALTPTYARWGTLGIAALTPTYAEWVGFRHFGGEAAAD